MKPVGLGGYGGSDAFTSALPFTNISARAVCENNAINRHSLEVFCAAFGITFPTAASPIMAILMLSAMVPLFCGAVEVSVKNLDSFPELRGGYSL